MPTKPGISDTSASIRSNAASYSAWSMSSRVWILNRTISIAALCTSQSGRVDGTREAGDTISNMETTPLATAPQSLLRRLYDELLEPAFPPAELMTYDELEGAVESGDATGLVLTEDDAPLASVCTEDFLDGRVTLLSYLVVSAGHRSRGLGTHLLDRACATTRALVLAEI